MKKKFAVFAVILSSFILFSCSRSGVVISVDENDLFKLNYGSFEDELNMFDISLTGNISTYIAMRDGFFYIANGESKKIMETNSYGDLLSLYYNNESVRNLEFEQEDSSVSTKKSVKYPFNTLGPIAVDSRKYLYVVDTLPQDRFEHDEENRLLLNNVVLMFDVNGQFVNYIGQQGLGGTPFPIIRKIYTTKKNELVVVCTTNEGLLAYWFNNRGALLYRIPVTAEQIPMPADTEEEEGRYYTSVGNVVPDYNENKLYIKVDFYQEMLDSTLKKNSGVTYRKTLLYALNLNNGEYEAPLEIPAYEHTILNDMSKTTDEIPFDFLGVTENGWFFFIITSEEGYIVQMVQPDGQKIFKRSLTVDHSQVFYYTLDLSSSGIVSGLFVLRNYAKVSWWRTDSLLAAYISN